VKKDQSILSIEAFEMVAARFKVLADPLRLRILHALEAGALNVTSITEEVQATQPNVSKHLKTLQDAGMVARRQQGNVCFYSIADESIFQLCDLVRSSLLERFAAHASIIGKATARRR